MHSSTLSYKSTKALGALLLVLNALTARAFQVEYGTECDTVGEACSYISDNSSVGGSAETLVEGFCAPDLHCASQGATCSTDDNCLNYCGTDGTCGGEGAGCNTQETFSPGQNDIACFDDSFRCTTTGGSEAGQCLPIDEVDLIASPTAEDDADAAVSLAPSQANARRNKKRMDTLDAAYHQHQVRSSDLRRAFARHAQVQAPRKVL